MLVHAGMLSDVIHGGLVPHGTHSMACIGDGPACLGDFVLAAGASVTAVEFDASMYEEWISVDVTASEGESVSDCVCVTEVCEEVVASVKNE